MNKNQTVQITSPHGPMYVERSNLEIIFHEPQVLDIFLHKNSPNTFILTHILTHYSDKGSMVVCSI